MKVRKLINGDALQVGDIIVCSSCFGERHYPVTRVTKKYAFVKHNDTAEGKYPNVFDYGFQSYPKQLWNTTTHYVYRPVEKAVDNLAP